MKKKLMKQQTSKSVTDLNPSNKQQPPTKLGAGPSKHLQNGGQYRI
jgi:hypothetical protein